MSVEATLEVAEAAPPAELFQAAEVAGTVLRQRVGVRVVHHLVGVWHMGQPHQVTQLVQQDSAGLGLVTRPQLPVDRGAL